MCNGNARYVGKYDNEYFSLKFNYTSNLLCKQQGQVHNKQERLLLLVGHLIFVVGKDTSELTWVSGRKKSHTKLNPLIYSLCSRVAEASQIVIKAEPNLIISFKLFCI